MTIRHAAQSIGLLGVVLLVSACDGHESFEGERRSAARPVGSFDSIDMNGSARLEITVGQRESVTIEGPAQIVERTVTEVHGDTLRVRTGRKDWVWTNGQPRITVKITVPQLASLRLQGGNDVRLAGFKGGDSRIEVEGAAHLRASGALDELTVDMAGAGVADLSELIANDARVTVDGVGRVVVHPKDTLSATMNGVGAILYVGSPREVNTRMNGLGTISQRGRDAADHDRRKRPESSPDRKLAPERVPQPEVDPDQLQPEYDDRPKKPVSMTEVI